MRVLALLTDGYGAHGGIAQFNRDWMEAISAMPELQSLQALVRHGKQFDQAVLKQHVHPSRLGFVFAAFRAAIKLRPNLIFCGHLNLAPLSALLAWLIGARLILQTHGIDAWSRPSALKRLATQRCTMVQSVSRFTRREVLRWSGLDPERVRVLPNTVRSAVSVEQSDLATARARLNLSATTRLLITVSRMDSRERYKGHESVLRACAELPPTLDWHYAVAGSGDDCAHLQQLSTQLALGNRVQFLGQISDSERNVLLHLADVLVMPSSAEGFGIVYLEALLAGTPVIGSPFGGAPDPISASRYALAPSSDALSATLLKCLSSPKPELEAVRAGVAERFGPHIFARNSSALLRYALISND